MPVSWFFFALPFLSPPTCSAALPWDVPFLLVATQSADKAWQIAKTKREEWWKGKNSKEKKYDFLLQCRQSPWSTSKMSMESMHLQYLPATSHHCTSTQQVSSYPASCLSPVTPPAIKPLVSLHTHSKITLAYNVLLLPQTDGLFLSNCLHEVFIW